MSDINPVSAALLAILVVPLIMGAFERFSRAGIHERLWAFLDTLGILLGLYASVLLTKKIFFDHQPGIFQQIYNWIPENIRIFLYGQDVFIYIIVVPIIFLILIEIIRLINGALFDHLFGPLADSLSSFMSKRGKVSRGIIGSLVQLPRAAFLLLIAGLLLNFISYYYPSPVLAKWMNESHTYQALYRDALYPALNSNLAKKIPVIVNDSFARTADFILPSLEKGIPDPTRKPISGRVIEYFNGVTLDQAIRSSPEIDETARDITAGDTTSKAKAYHIYRWVSQNLEYDSDKAARISRDTSGIASGSLVAFDTRSGICFDYSSLYISMCRAVGLKVRLVTGLGYSGISWGDHAWNQVYCSEEKRWINVDTTFGSNGNYFDKADFSADHRYGEVQGEW